MEFIDGNRVKVDPPKKPKKITATRFGSILGVNAWNTPFSAWCEITRTYEDPFVESKYTKAGKIIEPKVIEYLQSVMFMDIKSPTDVYGENYFKETWGDFFSDVEALGGMWDALGDDYVVEIKTTKRAEDWTEDIPIYYKLQAALYAYLLGFDDVVVTVSFLEEKDYTNPEAYVVSVDNTKLYLFKVSEAFPDFEENYITPALDFWRDYVMTGISPEFDEKKDADILKELRKNTVIPDDKDIIEILKEADKLQASIDLAEAKISEKKARLKELDDKAKKYMAQQFRDGDNKVVIDGSRYKWTLTKSTRTTVDTAALKKAGLYADYSKQSETLTLKKALIEED